MTNRRNFLTRSGLALGALIVGDAALEAMERLTHKRIFALGMPTTSVTFSISKVHDISFYDYEAVVKTWNYERTYRTGIAYLEHPSALGRQRALYGIGKLASVVEKNHAIPFPEMSRAVNEYFIKATG